MKVNQNNVNEMAKHANKIDVIQKELKKRDNLVRDLKMDVGSACTECDKLQN